MLRFECRFNRASPAGPALLRGGETTATTRRIDVGMGRISASGLLVRDRHHMVPVLQPATSVVLHEE